MSQRNATRLSSRVKLLLPKKIVSLKILQKMVIFKGGYLARSCKITSLDRLGYTVCNEKSINEKSRNTNKNKNATSKNSSPKKYVSKTNTKKSFNYFF